MADRWFSPGSSTNKTDCRDITEILFRVALNTITITLTVEKSSPSIYRTGHILFIWRDCLTFRSTSVHIHFLCGLRVAQYLDFCVMFCISLFVRLYLFFSRPLYCPHFDIWLLITPLTSSSFMCCLPSSYLKKSGNQNP
jgi:hypothetical protein